MVGDRRAGVLGVEHVFQDQARVVGLAVTVEMGPHQPGGAQVRGRAYRARGPRFAARRRVGATAPTRCRGSRPLPERPGPDVRPERQERESRRGGRDGARCASDARRSASPSNTSAEVSVLQVAEAAVDQLRGAAGGLASEVAGLDERDVQAPQRGVACGRRAGGPAAHHQQVERLRSGKRRSAASRRVGAGGGRRVIP